MKVDQIGEIPYALNGLRCRLSTDVYLALDPSSPHVRVFAVDEGLAGILASTANDGSPFARREFLDRRQSMCASCSVKSRRVAKSVVLRRTKGELGHFLEL